MPPGCWIRRKAGNQDLLIPSHLHPSHFPPCFSFLACKAQPSNPALPLPCLATGTQTHCPLHPDPLLHRCSNATCSPHYVYPTTPYNLNPQAQRPCQNLPSSDPHPNPSLWWVTRQPWTSKQPAAAPSWTWARRRRTSTVHFWAWWTRCPRHTCPHSRRRVVDPKQQRLVLTTVPTKLTSQTTTKPWKVKVSLWWRCQIPCCNNC